MCITMQTSNDWLEDELLLIFAPVRENTASSDVLHCVYGEQGSTTIAWK